MNNIDDVIGFASVALPGTGAFIQLPDVPAAEIGLGATTADVQLAGSATPGTNFVLLQTSAAKALVVTSVPCGGNVNNLWMASVGGAQSVGFMWRKAGAVAFYHAV